MTDQIQTVPRRHIRIKVEPVAVELDDIDGNLLFATLQAAFPGGVGLYYYGPQNVKTTVRFDGQKLYPPIGDWEDRDYYVTLGGRHVFPFGSYENAAKQFERSVNLVEKMLGSFKKPAGRVLFAIYLIFAYIFDFFYFHFYILICMMFYVFTCFFFSTDVDNIRKISISPPSPTSASPNERMESIKQMVNSLMRKRESRSPNHEADEALTPLEHQFVELAKISTGKDMIIEAQRKEIVELNEKINHLTKKVTEAQSEIDRVQLRCNAQEEELDILRSLSKEQTYMCEKVNELTKHLVETKEISNAQIQQLEDKLAIEYSRNDELLKQNAESSKHIGELEEQLAKSETSILDLRAEIDTIKENLSEKTDELSKRCSQSGFLEEELSRDNTRLLERCKELEKKLNTLTKQLDEIDVVWKKKLDDAVQVELEKYAILSRECDVQRTRIAELTSLADQMSRENANLLKRFEEAKNERTELLRHQNKLEARSRQNGSAIKF
uniref:TAR DNA-binding protein 43 N-terminal domain-containing protein n=1 Tax=Acrobeloides nanus TaxID=290746 RepID=A0A914EHM9_9BILA